MKIAGVADFAAAAADHRDLLAQGSTDSNLISYMMEAGYTNAAHTVAEGGTKPESTLTFNAVSDPVRKIAHWLPVTEEILSDTPALRAYIDARLASACNLSRMISCFRAPERRPTSSAS